MTRLLLILPFLFSCSIDWGVNPRQAYESPYSPRELLQAERYVKGRHFLPFRELQEAYRDDGGTLPRVIAFYSTNDHIYLWDGLNTIGNYEWYNHELTHAYEKHVKGVPVRLLDMHIGWDKF